MLAVSRVAGWALKSKGLSLVIAIVVIYLLGMLFIGWLSSRRIHSGNDFLLAGRRLGPWLMAGTLAATELGGGSTMGVAEKAYGSWGLSAGWYVLAMSIALLLIAFVAPRLRRAEVRTVPEYFSQRYGPKLGLVTSFLFIVPLVGLTATQFIASAVILSVMTGLDYSSSVVIVVVVITAYSIMGGLWSVTLTDIVQFFFIVCGLGLALPFALQHAGGWDTVVATVPTKKFHWIDGTGWKTVFTLVVMYVSSFAIGQETVQRFFAARDGKTAATGTVLAAVAFVLFAFVPALLGLIAFSMVQTGVLDGGLIAEQGNRYVLPLMALKVLPSWLVGIVFAALISATMSSASSDLLAAGSIFSNDIYAQLVRKGASDKKILKVTRLAMVVIALCSTPVALNSTSSIIGLLMFSFSLRAAGAFVPYVFGHYWKSANALGAWSSIVAGSAFVIGTHLGVLPETEWDALIPAITISLVVFVACGILAKNKVPNSSTP
jgi:SSS family solute:Na+ symporter